ncbi:hypothetical protein ACR42D_12025 [Desulfovibrio caledoniensis]
MKSWPVSSSARRSSWASRTSISSSSWTSSGCGPGPRRACSCASTSWPGGRRTITELSYALSESINALADKVDGVLTESVERVADVPALVEVLLAYCPAVLVEHYRDRIVNDLPRPHQLALLASYISARMLYQEGLGWADRLVSLRDVREVVFGYLEQEKVVAGLMAEVRGAGLVHAELIDRILDFSGRKLLTLDRLGLG